MPEPIDTIRRVNADIDSMTLEELQTARAILDRHSASKKTDVREARRRVGKKIDQLTEAASPTATAVGATVAAPGGMAKEARRRQAEATVEALNSSEPASPDDLEFMERVLVDYIDKDGGDDAAREALRQVRAKLRAHPGEGRSAPPRRTMPQPVRPAVPAKKGGNPIVGFIALLVVVGVIVYACSHSGSDGSGSHDSSGNPGMAKVMCEDFIKDRLKAPSTADFSGIFDTEISGSGPDYTVRGYVDAENSFGANLRSNYVCQVHDDGNDHWTLVSLTGLN